MALIGKKDQPADEELLEDSEQVEPEAPEEEPEPEGPPAEVVEARDGARVCFLINQAIQSANALAGGIVFSDDRLAEIKEEAAVHAARAQGTWMAVDNGSLPASAQAAEAVNIFADEEQLGKLAAAVIVDARDQLQELLGQVEEPAEEPSEPSKKDNPRGR